jgi:MerR family transcriptional regulator, light-induced transcriptional regulator
MPSFITDSQPHADLARSYLAALLRYERAAASDLIMWAVQNNASVKDIYQFVFEPCQYEIGRLWQSNVVSVPQEHYCTASTQVIMAQLYPYIFRVEKVSATKIVATCASGELHEMGARMLCDLLEMEGWSTIYLGANVPSAGIVKALRDSGSTVLAISASMTFHIPAVREMITAVRTAQLGTKIIVGGYLFKSAPNLWSEVGADQWIPNATDAVEFLKKVDDGVKSC